MDKLGIRRILLGRLSVNYTNWFPWDMFFYGRQWGGRLFTVSVSKFTLTLDCRKCILRDIATGVIE